MTGIIHVCDHCAGRGYVPEPFSGDGLVMCPECGGIGRVEPPLDGPDATPDAIRMFLANTPEEMRKLARQLRTLAAALEAAAGAGPEDDPPADMVLRDEAAA